MAGALCMAPVMAQPPSAAAPAQAATFAQDPSHSTPVPNAARAQAIAQFTLVSGQVSVQPSQEKQTAVPVRQGDFLFAGQAITTQANSHAHLRFTDGGLLSIRPDSRLVVTHYSFSPTGDASPSVRFDLEKGVARAITGQAAQRARDRFRFNTPVAALGVRGTDFAVFSSRAESIFTVHSGVVVVSGFGPGCALESLAPCLGPNSLELSRLGQAHTALVNLASERPQPIPEVPQALRSAQAGNGRATAANGESANGNRGNGGPRGGSEASTGRSQASGGADQKPAATSAEDKAEKPQLAASGAPASPAIRPDKPAVAASPSAEVAPVADPALTASSSALASDLSSTKKAVLEPGVDQINASKLLGTVALSAPSPSPDKPDSLIWGHWEDQAWLSHVYASAAQARQNRQVTVGNRFVGLYREPFTQFAPERQSIELQLGAAQVFYSASPVSQLGVARSGSLSFDFTQGSFQTSLQGSHPDVGGFSLAAAGKVDTSGASAGIFRSEPALSNARIAGSLTADAQQAGYFFEQPVAGGVLLGTTLWRR